MKYFLVRQDFDWQFKHDVECYVDDHWRMPGINCPVHPRVNPTYVDGYSYPASRVIRDPILKRALRWGADGPESELDWQEQWKQPEKWHELKERILKLLPYALPISPGTVFGAVAVKLSGAPADFYKGFLGGHYFLSGSALERLKAAGVADLFSAPCTVLSKRTRDVYYELQIEQAAAMANDLVFDAKRRDYHAKLGYPLRCEQCGKAWGKLPEKIVLKGDSIPAGASLFRLQDSPAAVICNDVFAGAAERAKLTNLVFLPVRTDGSEKGKGLRPIQLSRPVLWSTDSKPTSPPKFPRASARRAPASPVKLIDLIARVHLESRTTELLRLQEPGIRLAAIAKKRIGTGESRVGGLPDLPKTAKWPGSPKAPVDFLLQVNLKDAAKQLPKGALPSSGLLSFFYNSETCPWGTRPEDKDGWKVVFSDAPSKSLLPTARPGWLSEQSILPVCALTFTKTESLPALDTPEVENLKLPEQERVRYSTLLKKLRYPTGKEFPLHKMLGHPDAIQRDMTVTCATAVAGLDGNFKLNPKIPKQRKIAQSTNEWTLLLQLDSDEKLGLQWADAGRLFFWIRKRDLASCRFDRCWVVLQSY